MVVPGDAGGRWFAVRVAFRADASIQIGTGHVMRCLTLADELTRKGHECRFVCREHEGHLGDLITGKGYDLTLLPAHSDNEPEANGRNSDNYERWLGVLWQEDARQTLDALKEWKPDWLVVDHYALDARWEKRLKPHVGQIMVIDDLANRPHDSALLLDQNLGRSAADYDHLVPCDCVRLIGPKYALLRPEFAELRDKSLARRKKEPSLMHILVTMGGVDPENATGAALDALTKSNLPETCRISVVMGTQAPWLHKIKAQAAVVPYQIEVLSGISNMAEVMTSADLAIGAAGSTSWERCCLGLPTFMFVLAENQRSAAKALQDRGCAKLLGSSTDKQLVKRLEKELASLQLGSALIDMINKSCSITDGRGVWRLINAMRD